MLELGGDLSAADKEGRTPLHFLVQVDKTGTATQWLLSLKNLEGSYDVNAQTKSGVTPLMLAVKLNHAKVVELILGIGASPFLKD